VRANVRSDADALLDDVIETTWRLSGRQFGGGQLCKLTRRGVVFIATATGQPAAHPAVQQTNTIITLTQRYR